MANYGTTKIDFTALSLKYIVLYVNSRSISAKFTLKKLLGATSTLFSKK